MVSRSKFGTFSFVVLFAAPAVLQAQQGGSSGGGGAISIPAAYMPPPGMCRLWVPGVAANRQPAITTCAVAVRNRAGDAQVIYGRDTTTKPPTKATPPDSGKTLPVKIPPKVIPPPRTDTLQAPGVLRPS
jgi:hypothetical protein